MCRSKCGQREFLRCSGRRAAASRRLLYQLGGFLPTEAGTITVDGKPVKGPGPDRGIVFQHFALFPWKTVRANVHVRPASAWACRAPNRKSARRTIIDLVGLRGFRGQLPVAALRRHEAAHRDRAHARDRSGNSSDGRAVRRARCADAPPDADRTARRSGSARPRPSSSSRTTCRKPSISRSASR